MNEKQELEQERFENLCDLIDDLVMEYGLSYTVKAIQSLVRDERYQARNNRLDLDEGNLRDAERCLDKTIFALTRARR